MNYEKIGLRIGLEVHNRLLTKHKLFCDCPPRFSNQKPSYTIKRKLRAVAGELGQIDVAAVYEYLRDRTFYYQIFDDTVCLVETDSEPPHDLNQEALEIALQISKLLKAKVPDEIHVMRKTVIDGSNTAGFQRTAIVGMDGILKTSQGDVKITNISLEEESAGIVKQKRKEITYRLDRLGIPLIEVGTAPDIKNPEHAKEVAEKIGMIIRSTRKSQRGIGVTRQDINLSIKGGGRIEVKGVQELGQISKIIENEIHRQIKLVKQKKSKEETRVAKPDGATEFLRPLPGGERLYPETDAHPIILTRNYLKQIKIPETWENKRKRILSILTKELANQILKSEYLDLFEKFYKIDSKLVASTFTSTLKDLRRQKLDIDKLEEMDFENLFKAIKSKRISKDTIPEILEKSIKENKSVKDVIKEIPRPLSEKQLKTIVRKVFKKNPQLVKDKRVSALMGEIMKEVKGVSGKVVMKVLRKELK